MTSKKLQALLHKFPKTYSEELGINLSRRAENEIFKWFLASVLFGHRISENIAKRTYREFEKEKLATPQSILNAGWDKLVEVLDRGGYVRYDFSTASALLEITQKLKSDYNNSLENLHERAGNAADLEKKLMEFKRVGPVTTNIFLRELRAIWPKADSKPSKFVILAAKDLKVNLKLFNRKTMKFVRLESALLRYGKELMHKETHNLPEAFNSSDS
jgi:endonuclease III